MNSIILDEPNNFTEHLKKCKACNRPFNICLKAVEIHKHELEIQKGINLFRHQMYLKYSSNPQLMTWKEYNEYNKRKKLIEFSIKENVFRK